MRIKNSETSYGLVSKLVHWLIALSIIGLVWLGWYMVDLTYLDRWYKESLTVHKSIGMLVLGFAVVYFAWKAYSPSPPPAADGPAWQRSASRLMHYALMAMMVAIPVTGYLISTWAGKPVSIFGLFDIPAVLAKNEKLRDLAIDVHFYLAYAVGILVLGHAGAAIKHQFVDRDGTLARMLWR